MSKFKLVTSVEEVEKLTKTGQSTTVRVSKEVHDFYLEKAIKSGLEESRLTDEEMQKLISLKLKPKGKVYFRSCDCKKCKRKLHSYDFIMTGVKEHGLEMVQKIFASDDIIFQVNPRLDHILCSNCSTRIPLEPAPQGARSAYFWTLLYGCTSSD